MLKRTALVIISPLLMAILGALSIEPSIQWSIPSDRIAHQSGYSYFVDLSKFSLPLGYELKGDSSESPRYSTLTLLRGGQPLGPAHSAHDTIAKKGGGSFSHWQTGIYFSTPGNTDPRNDAYSYEVRATAQLPDGLRRLLTVAAICLAFPLAYAAVWLLRVRYQRLVVPLKFAALAIVCVMAPWFWWAPISREVQRLTLAGDWLLLLVYLVSAVVAIAALLVAPFIRDWRARVPLVMLLLAAFAVDQIMLSVSRQPMSFELMQTFLRERAMAATVLPAYGTAIFNQLALTAGLAIPLLLTPSSRVALQSRYSATFAAAFLVATAVIYTTKGRADAFPGPVGIPSQLAAAAILANSNTVVERFSVDYSRTLSSPYKKIVMVVDESVRGDYLGLNNPKYDNSPTLSGLGNELANFGVAVSASNCSVAARLILRVGLQRHQLPDTREVWRRLPTIWQFAKKAGYQTALIDGWRAIGEFHSYMDAEEARLIDISKSAMSGPEYNYDAVAADQLIDLLKQPEPMFIYVNKHGIHPDYGHRFHPALDYEPTAGAGSTLDPTRQRSVKNYHKALRWSVDGFFEKIRPALRRDDLILIYTSDHGQSLYEGGYDLSHCSLTTDLHRGEVLVPLFLIVQAPSAQATFGAQAKRAFNRASHFEVMPTLLELMGYSADWVHSHYGPGLADFPLDRRRGFLMGTFFHPGAVWIDFE